MSFAVTILSGLAILVSGQIIIRCFLDPIFDLRKTVGEIADALIYHANIYSNPDSNRPKHIGEEAVQVLRQKATSLLTRTQAVLFYDFFARLGLVPPRSSIDEAWKELVGLSNSIYSGTREENEDRRRIILNALHIPDWKTEVQPK